MESNFIELNKNGRIVLVSKNNIAFIEADNFNEKRVYVSFNFGSGKDLKPHREVFDNNIDELINQLA